MTAIFKTKPANFANAALWQPPGKAKDLEAGPSQWYYWTGGNMSPANPPSLVDPLETASVFRQNNGGYILGTFGDATQEVPPTGWRTLQFHRGPTTTGCFTQIDLIGPLEGAASPLPDHIVPELLPHIYQCQSNKPPEFAGLTGKLSLLIAIAALSASWDELRNIMTKHVKPRRWVPHGKGSAKSEHFRRHALDLLAQLLQKLMRVSLSPSVATRVTSGQMLPSSVGSKLEILAPYTANATI